MGAPRVPYMAKTDKERLATGFWNRIESNQAANCNTDINLSVLNSDGYVVPSDASAASDDIVSVKVLCPQIDASLVEYYTIAPTVSMGRKS